MTLKPVLYSILLAYADKEHSPYIETEPFILFVEKYARHIAGEQPEWTLWSKDASRKVWEDLGPLIEEGKCALLTEKTGARIFMRRFYIDLLEAAYLNPDGTVADPFPSAKSIRVKIPAEHLKPLNVATDMVAYLDNPQTELMPLISLVFPPKLPDALALSAMIPRRLSEMAMLKVRYFLRINDNKDYLQSKLLPHYQGREGPLKELFNRILMRPLDCLKDLENGDDFPFMFWAAFCNLVRSDIVIKTDLLNEDVAVMQSSYILEIMNNYFRAKAFKRKEREIALNDLELEFDQAPFAFSMETVQKFVNSKGVPLLGLYSREDLQQWLAEKTQFATAAALPEILMITGPADLKRYIKKAHYFDFSVKLLNEARPVIRRALKDRWLKILREYGSENAMEKDDDYEKLLQRLVGELAPELMAVLVDKKLCLACDELEKAQGFIPENSRFFLHGGALLPLETMLLMKRRDIMAETRTLLPFWYSVSLFVLVITFFKKLKSIRFTKQGTGEKNSGGRPPGNRNRDRKIQEVARQMEAEMVPFGSEIDAWLENLENRWNTLLTTQARENLSTDVRALIRDRLRQVLHGQRPMMLTRDSLEKLAERIVDENNVLRDLHNKENLRQFIVLYMVKLLVEGKI